MSPKITNAPETIKILGSILTGLFLKGKMTFHNKIVGSFVCLSLSASLSYCRIVFFFSFCYIIVALNF